MRRPALTQQYGASISPESKTLTWGYGGALGGTRTPNLLIRSQMLYPLSYERGSQQYTALYAVTVRR